MANDIEHGSGADNAQRANDVAAYEIAQTQTRMVSKQAQRGIYGVWQGTPGGNEAYVEATTAYRNVGLTIGALVGALLGVAIGRYVLPKRGR